MNKVKQKILVVDSSKSVRTALEEIIKSKSKLDLTVDSAETFSEAQRLIDENSTEYFLAVSALVFHDAPNGEIVDLILAKKIPLIVLTASYTDEIREKMFSKNVVDYVVKKQVNSLLQVVRLIQRLQKNQAVKVLVVDDSQSSRFFIKRLLNTYQYQTLEVSDGVHALQVLKKNPDIELIITDFHMPIMNGFELIAHVRKTYTKEQLAIIGLSSKTDKSFSTKILKSGANDFLPKPFTIEEFHCRVTQNIEIVESFKKLNDHNLILTNLNDKMTDDLEQARLTQSAIFPQQMPSIPGIQIAAEYLPMDQLGGDFYDVIELEDGRVALIIADVTGHGVSAALVSFMISGFFKSFAPKSISSATTLEIVNQSLYEKIPEDKFATVFYCIYDSDSKSLIYSSAGHPAGYVIRNEENRLITIQKNSVMLGAFPNDMISYEDGNLKLIEGDKLFLYTDGITEITNPSGIMLENKGLEDLLLHYSNLPISDLLDSVKSYVHEFAKNKHLSDDITMLGMEIVT